MRNRLIYVVAAAVTIAVTVVYWPVLHGGFVWADVFDFVDMTWLTHGDDWKHYIFKGFNNWSNYFRPLVVALYTLQLRLFGVIPAPMHAVSLAVHLINVVLVGLLAWHCNGTVGRDIRRSCAWIGGSMLLYGLHPILVESVAWIGCQFDLVATMFMLGALLANVRIRPPYVRAIIVASLFFLAACSKESAASFPLMLAIFEWALLPQRREGGMYSSMYAVIKRNWQTYVAMALAGITYLAVRHWALGQLVNPTAVRPSSLLGQVQQACFVYLQYWKMLVWPMSGINPLHEMDMQPFQSLSGSSLLIDAFALGTVITSTYFALKRKSPAACLVTIMTAALLPVLHVAPVAFAPSLYHERYAMTSLATLCAMLPLIRFRLPGTQRQIAFIRVLATAIVGLWFVLALVNIRMTVPLWSNNVALWQWAVVGNPGSVNAKDNLLGAYIDSRNYRAADALVDQISASHKPCTDCMLNAAMLAVAENNPKKASLYLQQVQRSQEVVSDKQMFRMYLFTTGKMLLEQNQPQEAEGVFRSTVTMDPTAAQPQLWLAVSLAMQGKNTEAFEVGQSAIAMLPPSQRDSARTMLERIATSNSESSRPDTQGK